jgi:hypothetical protein
VSGETQHYENQKARCDLLCRGRGRWRGRAKENRRELRKALVKGDLRVAGLLELDVLVLRLDRLFTG